MAFLKEYKYETGGQMAGVKYQIEDGCAVLTGCFGKIYDAILPDALPDDDGIMYPITSVIKKSFFGAKMLKNVSLPGTVSSIGDWAFSSCTNLESFEIRKSTNADDVQTTLFGQGVFQKDDSLKIVDVIKKDEVGDIPYLLSAAATTMGADYLLTQVKDFYEQWDAKLVSILAEPDDDGFVFMVLCGEEDLTADIDEYKEQRRRRKCRLAFLRLVYDSELTEEMKSKLSIYLKEHTCGCDSEAAFDVVLENSEDERYQQLFFSLPMIDDGNFDRILSLLDERYAPFKAKVLSFRQNSLTTSSGFFDEFEF